jgi:predicted glycosyltransferase
VRVWVDFTNTAHVVVLLPLVELLEARGHDVTLTARPLSHTTELLEQWGRPFTVLGRYGGARRVGKAAAIAERLAQVLRFARTRDFDCGLAHGSTDMTAAGRLLGIPNTTMFDYEWARAQHEWNCRLATRVLVPDAIPIARVAPYGAWPPKLVRYPGLKEEYYLHDFEPDPHVLDELGLERARVTVVVRTAPSYALYLGGSENALLARVLERLSRQDVQTVVLARNHAQREAARAADRGFVVPDRAVDGRSLAALADVVVSAGGTMIREAAVLGTPAWTIFEGRPGAVDEQLEREGRIRTLRDPDELVLEKAPTERTRRARRDPGELLALALPWIR